MLLEQLERQVLNERQVAATFLAAGAKGVEMPDLQTARVEFGQRLHDLAEPVAPERRVLLAALGLTGG